MSERKNAALILENGVKFIGKRIGGNTDASGLVTFVSSGANLESFLTDPASAGMIFVTTEPVAGAGGFSPNRETTGFVRAAGLVTRESCDIPGGTHSGRAINLDTFLNLSGTPGIEGIDTRALTRIIRDNGAMRGTITSMNAAAGIRLAILDLGARKPLITMLERNSAVSTVKIYQPFTSANEILRDGHDALLVTNGPGTPEYHSFVVNQIKTLNGVLPLYGTGLGAVLIGVALGAVPAKLPYGRHSASVTVKSASGALYVTEHNSMYTVEALPAELETTFTNVIDGRIEGFRRSGPAPVYAVMFEPEHAATHKNATSFFYEKLLTLTYA